MKNPLSPGTPGVTSKLFPAVRRLQLLAAVSACALLAGVPRNAAAQDDIGTLYNKSVQEMNEQKWEEALKVIDNIVENFGEAAYEDYGALFGGIYYNRGICQLKMQDYEKAAESFRMCHEEFPNKKPEGKENAPDSTNPYEKTAVFQLALCKQLSQQYDEAIQLYQKFAELKPDPEELNAGAYFVQLGSCLASVGRLDEATENIQKVFDNQAAYRVPAEHLLQGFVQLGGAWARLAKEQPEVLEKANAFMDRYFPQLRMRPYDMQRYNPLVVRLAQEAGQERQYLLALRYYSLYSGVMDAIQDLLDRSIAYGGITEKLQEEIDKLQAQIDGGDPLDVNVWRGLGACYEGLGDFPAAYVVYQYLYQHYGKTENLPVILFSLARAATASGDVVGAQEYGLEFLEKFPDHELYDQVSRFVIGALFEIQEFQTCIDIALKIRNKLAEGSEGRDLLEFVLGGSYYSLGQFEKAQPVLDAHVEKYPESQYITSTRFFQASNTMSMQKFVEAAKLYDDYIEKFPLSPLLDSALFERARCEYLIQEENFDRALELIARLETEFPASRLLDGALVLRGDIQASLNDLETAAATYMQAKEASERLGNDEVGGEALSKAHDTYVKLEQWENATKAYDEFFEKFGETEVALQVAVVGLEGLKRTERAEEGLVRLEKMIVAMSKDANAEGMERAVNSYVSVSSETRGVDATVAKLDKFPGLDGESKTMEAWLIVSKIGLLQDQLKSLEESDPEYGKKNAMVKVAFDVLKNYDKSILGNYILIQVGRYIVNTGNPFEAMPFFEEIGKRDNKEFEDYALLEMAKVWARSPEKDRQERAIESFRKIIDVFQTDVLEEDALLGLARLYANQEDWEKTFDTYKKYLDNKSYNRSRPEANFMIGRSYEGKGDIARAQKAYINVFVLFTGHLEWSAQAVLRNAELEYQKGEKRNAYEMLRDGERRMGTHREKSEWVGRMMRRLDELREELGITPEMEAEEERLKQLGQRQ